MKNIAKCFYEDAKSYYLAAQTLSSCEVRDKDNQLLLMPITYLYRHAFELSLKYHIIVFLNQHTSVDIRAYELCESKGISIRQKLMRTHSIRKLYDCFSYWNCQSLYPKFTVKQIDYMKKPVKYLCDLDDKSDYFRYPTGKEYKYHKRHFITRIGDFGIAPEINNKYSVLTNDDGTSLFTAFNLKIFELQNELDDSIGILLN